MRKIFLLSLMICMWAFANGCSSKNANNSDKGDPKQEVPKGGGPKVGQGIMGGMERPKPSPENITDSHGAMEHMASFNFAYNLHIN